MHETRPRRPISLKSTPILTGILRLFPIHLDHFFALFLAVAKKFTMRFIQFVIAGAMLTLFNIHAYAKPVQDLGPGYLAPWCDGYNEDTCSKHCSSQGFRNSQCTSAYVQIPSYNSALMLTCKLQLLYLRVGYPSFYNFFLMF